MEANKSKKNCHNCKFGQYETEGAYGEYTYFVCEKREDDGRNNLDEKLRRASYLEKAKVCCELLVDVECVSCGGISRLSTKSSGHLCFPCWAEKNNQIK